jgi:2'-5' RNA ligase
MPNHLSVKRRLNSHEHQAIRSHMREFNHIIPDYVSLKWRKLGEVAVTLLGPGEFEHLTTLRNSGLKDLPIEDTLAVISEGIKQMRSGTNALTVKTKWVEVMGRGNFPNIAYILEAPEIEKERQHLTELLDSINGVNSRWRDYVPHVSLASVNRDDADQVTKIIEDIMPEELHFQPAEATIV